MWKRIRRRVAVDKTLNFEYEISPHRAFLARIAKGASGIDEGSNQRSPIASQKPVAAPEAQRTNQSKVGGHIPFKQVRLIGQINPLRPPLHVETVLIGRALGQPTGYLFGVGFRVRDDGYVEGEFPDAILKFTSFEELEQEISRRLGPSDNEGLRSTQGL